MSKLNGHKKNEHKERNTRTLIIGLDGATFRLLDPMMERGLLPNLAQFQQRSFRSVLQSTMPPVTAPAWTSFVTGTNPGQHGILHFLDFSAGASELLKGDGTEIYPGGFSPINASAIKLPTLWALMSLYNKSVGVINLPMSYPPESVNGFMVTGMLTPPSAKNFTYPPELAQELTDYQIDLALHEREFTYAPEHFLTRLREVLAKRQETALRLLQTKSPDVFMVVFTETDRVQHRFWHYLDPQDPFYESEEAKSFRPQLDALYHQLDDAIGELVAEAGPDCNVIVMSDHGFGPVHSHNLHRQALEQRLGLRKETRTSPVLWLRATLEHLFGFNREKLYRYAGPLLPKSAMIWIERRVHKNEQIAWASMPAYIVPLLEHLGGIFIRSTTDGLREQLIEQLQSIRDPQSGRPVVRTNYRREELYEGPHIDKFPHILFELEPGYVLKGGIGPNGALVSPRRDELEKQGTHRMDGVLLMAGPDIVPGLADQEVTLEDLLPTVMHLHALPVPTYVSGRVILEGLTREQAARPVAHSKMETIRRTADQEEWASAEDAQQVLARLRDLGYLH